jgi:hypothetical protein
VRGSASGKSGYGRWRARTENPAPHLEKKLENKIITGEARKGGNLRGWGCQWVAEVVGDHITSLHFGPKKKRSHISLDIGKGTNVVNRTLNNSIRGERREGL